MTSSLNHSLVVVGPPSKRVDAWKKSKSSFDLTITRSSTKVITYGHNLHNAGNQDTVDEEEADTSTCMMVTVKKYSKDNKNKQECFACLCLCQEYCTYK